MRGNAFIGCAPTRHVQTVQLSLRLAIIQQMNRSMPAACRQAPAAVNLSTMQRKQNCRSAGRGQEQNKHTYSCRPTNKPGP